MNDQSTISTIKNGDFSVFKYLYKYFHQTEKYVKNNSGSLDDAKDIFQQTLLIFHKNVNKPDFKLSSALSSYLFSISKNLWLKELRNKKNLKEQGLTNLEIEEEGDLGDNEELINNMRLGLKKLTENCQKLIRLYHLEEKKWVEIVGLMNYKNEHAARNQKYKCIQKLKQLLSN